jgi:hypothetical protein
MSLLFHRTLGPILVASMTEYQMIEISNQQAFREGPHMPLTPRVEIAGDRNYTSLSDLGASVSAVESDGQITFDVHGRMLTASHQAPVGDDVPYHLTYRLSGTAVEITASAGSPSSSTLPMEFILPVISQRGEPVSQPTPQTVQIVKQRGTLTVHTDAPQGFREVPKERTFNLVPGFECVAISVPMKPGDDVRIRLETAREK